MENCPSVSKKVKSGSDKRKCEENYTEETIKKGPILKNKVSSYVHRTSSGFNSYCDKGTSSFVENSSESIVDEKLAVLCLPINHESKKRKSETSTDLTEKELSEDTFDNTLDSVNISTLIEAEMGKTEAKFGDNDGFDAFASYLGNACVSTNVSKQITRECPQNDDDDIFPSFPDTQALQKIEAKLEEKLPNHNTENNKRINENKNVNKDEYSKQKVGDEKSATPLKLCFQERLKSKESVKENKIDQEIAERSILFENEHVTTEYRKEVSELFEQIENSICAMGEDEIKVNVPEEILDIIFNENNEAFSNKTDRGNDSEELQLTSSNLNSSFGTLIRKALINNSTKTCIERKKKQIETLNLSSSEAYSTFCSLGPFFGLPLHVKNLIKQFKGIEELYDWQEECLKLPAIENKKNLIYALPTSGGKTLVAEILMFRELLCYKKNAIFILPYVSIVQEKVWAISPFGVALDFLVEEYASSKGVYPPRQRRRKNSIYVATIEKALGIINSLIETGRLHEIGLIVVDEFHLIGEDGRGSILEAALTKILFLKSNIQIIAMSATIGNVSDLCTFLNADVYTKNFRPVELVEYVKCTNNIAKINWNYKDEQDLLVDQKKIDFKYSESILKLDPDFLGGLVMEVIPNGSCLVFCASKKNCENVANLLCKICKPDLKKHKKEEKQQLLHALKDESGKLCDILSISVQYGIAYHHSGLTSDERRIIEEGFRAGLIYVICCTSTLAAGVNLPAQRVILRSPYIGKDFINLSRYKQMVGRAGRAGLGETGESILICQPLDLPKVKDLLMSPMNKAMSNMHMNDGKGLRHLLLSCISLGVANTRVQLQEVAAHTLLAVQKNVLDVDIKKITDAVIKNLFKLGALKDYASKVKEKDISTGLADVSVRMDTSLQDTPVSESTETHSKKKRIVLTNDTKLVVSELGCAAIKGGLELSRAHMLYEDLFEAQSCLVLQGHLHLLYLVTPYQTADQIKPNNQVYYEVFTRLKPSELKVARTLGLNESVAVRMLSNNPIKTVPERVLNRFYLTLMLYDLWNEIPVFQVSEKYQINRGIVQNLMTAAATFASNVVNFCEQLEEFWAYAYLLKGMSQRLSHCCVKELLPLMDLPAVKQSRAKQLYNAGFKTLQSIAKANANALVENIEFMSLRVANQLIAASKMLLLEKVENLREEAEDVLDGVDVPRDRV
ncbi:helicase POLQ-like isoform X1 [Diorhabda carinulata]|uniref:helicase POLQ-like isoform X1 n=1 Tax=Diorhabda carinulata TaxID=1163345 RepID=UPI0025A1D5ED|nr:helicase POLQ-like isoform X1 [Diorhabda carinulata]